MPSPPGLTEMENCVLELHRIGVFKFGDFVLKSGIKSPIYFDLRVMVSYPKIMELVSKLIWKAVNDEKFDVICGVPYTALPIASVISVQEDIPMLIRRKEAKSYGLKKLVEGEFTPGQNCLIIEDVVVSGSSVLETVKVLEEEKLNVTRIVVFLDREQGGIENLANSGIECTSVVTIRQMLKILQKYKKVDDVIVENVMNYLDSNRNVSVLSSTVVPELKRTDSLTDRAAKVTNVLTKRLLTLIEKKKTNLCVAVDVETSEELLSMADKIGPHICILKTHIDILKDFTAATVESLKQLSIKHDFLIFEDRKFADIGNTVRLQYSSGVYNIFDWAHLVTVHGLPGPGVITGLKSCGFSEDRGCIVIAEMSSDENLANADYVKGCLKLAENHQDFVVGFVSQSVVHQDPNFILFTPGVNLSSSSDSLAQKYVTPEVAVMDRGADVVIVGRGVTSSADPVKKAKEYKETSFKALLTRALS